MKKALSLMLAAAFAFMLLPAQSFALQSETAEWALYMYMCGTDLETNYGCATNVLLEMIGADIPDSVKVAVFTGGTSAVPNVPNVTDKPDGNPATGIVITLIPAFAAAAGVVIFKKRR